MTKAELIEAAYEIDRRRHPRPVIRSHQAADDHDPVS
jgi:hypothetical protein